MLNRITERKTVRRNDSFIAAMQPGTKLKPKMNLNSKLKTKNTKPQTRFAYICSSKKRLHESKQTGFNA